MMSSSSALPPCPWYPVVFPSRSLTDNQFFSLLFSSLRLAQIPSDGASCGDAHSGSDGEIREIRQSEAACEFGERLILEGAEAGAEAGPPGSCTEPEVSSSEIAACLHADHPSPCTLCVHHTIANLTGTIKRCSRRTSLSQFLILDSLTKTAQMRCGAPPSCTNAPDSLTTLCLLITFVWLYAYPQQVQRPASGARHLGVHAGR